MTVRPFFGMVLVSHHEGHDPAFLPIRAGGSLFLCCSSEILGDALTGFHSRGSNGRLRAPRSEMPEPNGKKVANLSAKHKESIKLPDYRDGNGKAFPISEFLSHPSGVESILNTRALQSIECLETSTYRSLFPLPHVFTAATRNFRRFL